MGSCCGSRTEYLDIGRDNSKETREYNKILNFDWNQGLKNLGSEESKEEGVYLTVEEIILMRLTNDRAEFVTPQVAHISFTEFKKFMFLNKVFLEQERKREAAASEKEKKEKETQSRATRKIVEALILIRYNN